MKKVIIIGCPGAGKSTFAKSLHTKTNLPLFHLDMLFWNNDKTHVSRELFDQRLNDILNQERWIIDGNYSRTLETRFQACDTVFFLDMPTNVCLNGVKKRIGKSRDDMPWTEQEFDVEFKEWIIDFPKKELPKIYSLIEKYHDKKVVIFKSYKEIKKYLNFC